jgi:D-alanyl-D-alanine carboxypeptidase
MNRSLVAVVATATVAGTVMVCLGVARAGTSDRPAPVSFQPALAATLQADADALRQYGAPGVLVELETPRGDMRLRSEYGNVA